MRISTLEYRNIGNAFFHAKSQIYSGVRSHWHKLQQPRLSIKQQAFFAKRLAFLLQAGIPLLESVQLLEQQTKSAPHKKIYENLYIQISNGRSLAQSLRHTPGLVGEYAIQIITIGESSGTLVQNLEYLAETLTKQSILRRKIIGAFVYPALLCVTTIGITVFLLLYLFPKITPVFRSLNVHLPLSTRLVLSLSDFFIQYGMAALVVFGLTIGLFFVIRKKYEHSKLYSDQILLRVPIISTAIKNFFLASILRNISLLLRSGVPIHQALHITSRTITNSVYQQELASLAQSVASGQKISNSLSNSKNHFDEVCIQMLAVGERSGTLSETCSYLASMYESEVDEYTKNLSTLIEPALMIVMGLIVGLIAISIITPIYSITQNLHG